MVSSFYTGCMSGLMAVMEEGYYDNKGENKVVAFKKLKKGCLKHQEVYKKELGG